MWVYLFLEILEHCTVINNSFDRKKTRPKKIILEKEEDIFGIIITTPGTGHGVCVPRGPSDT